MEEDRTCDCGHPASFHREPQFSPQAVCGWNPPHSQLSCACTGPTFTGVSRDDSYHHDFKVGPQDQVRLRSMSVTDIGALCEVVLRNLDANIYASTSEEWHALGHQLALILWHQVHPGAR